MGNQVGRLLPLTAPRRLICDLIHFARRIPSVPVQRRMRLAPLVEARARQPWPIRWCTLLTKAYAQVAAMVPELRRAYLSFPRPPGTPAPRDIREGGRAGELHGCGC